MFYVYEHIRLDTNQVFYVGKGKHDRYKCKTRRNKYWHRVVAKAGGFKAVKLIENLDEELSLLAEQERINQLKRLGVKLCNITEGGEGCTGLKHTEEAKRKIGVRHSQESYDKGAEVRKQYYPFSEQHIKNMSEARKGSKNHMWGQTHNDVAREKIKQARLNCKRVKCPHCNKVADTANATRWHFDRCKIKGKKMSQNTKKTQTIFIDNVEHDLDAMTDEQKTLVQHCLDLDRKLASTQFQAQQLQVGKDAFLKMLKESLEKKED